jgi:hypothetical protein
MMQGVPNGFRGRVSQVRILPGPLLAFLGFGSLDVAEAAGESEL